MAYSASKLITTVFGNVRTVILSITADANSGAVDTGLGVIVGMGGVTLISGATGAQNFKINQNSGTTALNGSLRVSSCANGDTFHVVVHGR